MTTTLSAPDARYLAMRAEVRAVLDEVATELECAMAKFPAMASPHEGKAVIEEELDELWQFVKQDVGRGVHARTEAVQIAAMALRYVLDLSE